LNGAFSKVAKAGHVAGTKTREKFHMAVSNITAKVGLQDIFRGLLYNQAFSNVIIHDCEGLKVHK